MKCNTVDTNITLLVVLTRNKVRKCCNCSVIQIGPVKGETDIMSQVVELPGKVLTEIVCPSTDIVQFKCSVDTVTASAGKVNGYFHITEELVTCG